MTPATRALLAAVIESAVPLALTADGWTAADVEVDRDPQRGSAISIRGTATRRDETATLLTAEIHSDDRGRNKQVRITLQRPDHSLVRVSRKVMVIITTAVTD